MPDYPRWLRKGYWTLGTAVALLLEIDPDRVSNDRIDDQYGEQLCKLYWDTLDTAISCAHDVTVKTGGVPPGSLEVCNIDRVNPSTFVQWAKAKDYVIPGELKHLLDIPEQEITVQEIALTSKPERNLRQSQKAKVACQAIGLTLWKASPDMTITDMVKTDELQQFGNAAHYTEKTVRGWLSEVDPRPPEIKIGRPKK